MNGPVGLKNYGNTCFLNAVLQSLAYCDHFLNAISRTDPCGKLDCLLCNIETFILALRHPSTDPLLLDQYLSRLVRSFPVFPLKTLQRGRQEDAHEFIVNIILAFGGEHSRSGAKSHVNVANLFDGTIGSYIFCYECGNSSKKVEQMFGLELHINQQTDLESAINEYCRIENLSGSNSYACSYCQRNTRAQKCLRMEKLPKILIVQLKRFSFERNESRKINHYLKYPLDLDLKPYIMLDAKDADAYNNRQYNPRYRLASFIVHLGETVDSGHYIAFLRSQQQPDRWYKVDDLRVQEVSLDEIMSQLPYVLCYEQLERDHSSPLLHVSWDQSPSRPLQNNGCNSSYSASDQSPNGSRSTLTFSALMRGKTGFGFGSSPEYRQRQPAQEATTPLIDLTNSAAPVNNGSHVPTLQSSPSTYLKRPLHTYDEDQQFKDKSHESSFYGDNLNNSSSGGSFRDVMTLDVDSHDNGIIYSLLEGLVTSLMKGLISLTWWQLQALRDLILILLRKAKESLLSAFDALKVKANSATNGEKEDNGRNQSSSNSIEETQERISLLSRLSNMIDGLLIFIFHSRNPRRKFTEAAGSSTEVEVVSNVLNGNGHVRKKKRGGEPLWE